jgi:hypothetical protein
MPIPYDRLKQALLTEQAALTKELAELQSTIKEEGVGYSTHPPMTARTPLTQRAIWRCRSMPSRR